MENFVIHKLGEERYYVALRANNGHIILRGNDCDNPGRCKYIIDSIRANATDYFRYELMTSCDGKYYFKLKGSDGKDIAYSEIFDTAADRYAGILLVRRSIPYAPVDEQTIAV